MRKNFIFIILLISITIFSSCGNDTENHYQTEDFLMGTLVTQRIYGSNAEEIASTVVERFNDIEQKMTVNEAGSEIQNLNESAGKDLVEINEDSIYVLGKAKEYAELSKGTFDVTVGPIVKLWGIYTENPRIPTQDEIERKLALVGSDGIIVDSKAGKAGLAKQGQNIDLGGIAKGFAGDEAIEIYIENGIKSAYVNLGGNIVLLGSKPDNTPWRIGIQNPRGLRGKYVGIVKVSDATVVTSGDYERYFEKNGTRYHHIIDPRTGYPANSGLISATIVTGVSIRADALSTAVFVMGLEKGMSLVESLDDVEAVLITDDKKVYVSSGISSDFEFTGENKGYEYVKKR